MGDELNYYQINDKSLKLEFFLVPWDTEVCGYPVAQIKKLTVIEEELANGAWSKFNKWCTEQGVILCSCRLDEHMVKEASILQRHGFYFIEMTFQPLCNNLQEMELKDSSVEISQALPTDIDRVAEIARTAFTVERFHVDPFLGPETGNKRYENWARTSFQNKDHEVLKVVVDGRIAGFFITQNIPEKKECYWHLTAMAPEFQGRGLGSLVWRDMLIRNKRDGIHQVRTTISARNTAVMTIYAKLGFLFPPPKMTFHWNLDRVKQFSYVTS